NNHTLHPFPTRRSSDLEDTRPDAEKTIRQALVPTQDVVEIKNGKKVNVERKMYPGYVLVEMVKNQETLHTINGIQGVIKFVGTRSEEHTSELQSLRHLV